MHRNHESLIPSRKRRPLRYDIDIWEIGKYRSRNEIFSSTQEQFFSSFCIPLFFYLKRNTQQLCWITLLGSPNYSSKVTLYPFLLIIYIFLINLLPILSCANRLTRYLSKFQIFQSNILSHTCFFLLLNYRFHFYLRTLFVKTIHPIIVFFCLLF